MKITTKDIGMLVFTSALNLRERALSINNTWLKHFENGLLVGGYYFDKELKMISLGINVGEDYNSATKKQFWGLKKYFEIYPKLKWYYITGCDAFVFSDNLMNLLSNYDHNEDFFIGGHCGEIVVHGESIIYPSGGPGFILSHSLVAKIYPYLEKMVNEWEQEQTQLSSACDLAIAYYLYKYFSVKVTFADGFYHCPPYYYPQNTYKNGSGIDINAEVSAFPIAFHTLSIREIYKLFHGKKSISQAFMKKYLINFH